MLVTVTKQFKELSTHPYAVMAKHDDGSQGITGYHKTLEAAKAYLYRRGRIDTMEECHTGMGILKVICGGIVVYYWIISLDCVE